MSSDQCALNLDGTLKDAKDIPWFYDKDDDEPLPPLAPAAAQSVPLGCGLHNKTTNHFSDAIAHEHLGSDEDLDASFELPKCRHATHASKSSAGASVPPLSSRNSFKTLQVEESL